MSQTKKSSFSITCDRLNQYIKQKKTFPVFGDLNLNTSLAQDLGSTLDLFPGTELNKTCTTKPGMKQLTISYNGEVVNIDNIKDEQAEELIAFATLIATLREVRLNVVMPITRRKSLQSFLQKRKDPINSPYPSKQAASDDKAWLRLSL